MTEDTQPNERVWLVAYDFSACSEAAADQALDDLLDSRRGGRLVLAHVFSVLLPPGTIEPSPRSAYFLNAEEAARTDATRGLEHVAERLRKRQKKQFAGPAPVEIEVTTRLGTPAEGILEEAAARHASRIVVGTHGRKGMAHLILGSVAERIVRLSTLPVLVAHESATRQENAA